MNICKLIMRLLGWRIQDTLPYRQKCVICVAPHTSNWDFVIGQLAYASIGRRSCFLMKKEWFIFPLGLFFKTIGGIPVNRGKTTSLSKRMINFFRQSEQLNLAITPEGTRSPNKNWHTGFLHIAEGAYVPIQCGVIDYSRKCVSINKEFTTTGDVDSDMQRVKDYFKEYRCAAKYPEKFMI